MTVKQILDEKGHDVVTLGPNEPLSEAVRLLADRRIGVKEVKVFDVSGTDHRAVLVTLVLPGNPGLDSAPWELRW